MTSCASPTRNDEIEILMRPRLLTERVHSPAAVEPHVHAGPTQTTEDLDDVARDDHG